MAKSYRHSDKRAHIPSKEEAGYENANPNVQKGKKKFQIPVNPVIERGRDPELFWMHKYNNDKEIALLLDAIAESNDKEEIKELAAELRESVLSPEIGNGRWKELLEIDIRSLYRYEHIAPEKLIKCLHRLVEEKQDQHDLFSTNELFGNALEKDELEKVSEYYQHSDGWSNRLIQGDSLLVMSSLLEREGMAGQVQMIYIDPPYGIKYGSNWQMKLNNRNVTDGKDNHLSGEPEVIKAYRDTWELGIHSYLTYLKERLLAARELLKESGSCFVQISDENVHLVRNLMDEVFGSENFVRLIFYKTTTGLGQKLLDKCGDYIIWYAKNIDEIKYRDLFWKKSIDDRLKATYNNLLLPNGEVTTVNSWENENKTQLNDETLPKGAKLVKFADLKSQSGTGSEIEIRNVTYVTNSGSWKTNQEGINNLVKQDRIHIGGTVPTYVRYHNDFPCYKYTNMWDDTGTGGSYKKYVVQTNEKIIQRCMLMSSDPGDLVLDPTCGSGTTAYVAEEWGRRWITIETSRIALNIAKTRLMTATYPYYYLHSETNVNRVQTKYGGIKKDVTYKSELEQGLDIRQGFVYEEVPHITLRQLANNEPPETETLYDKPFEDKKKLRVSGPFTVETLQNFEPIAPEQIGDKSNSDEDGQRFEELVFEHLKSAGVKNGIKNEQAVFKRIESLADVWLNAEGFYDTDQGERKAYMHIGPKFGTVSKEAVNNAVKECRARGDADWLIILAFSFESDIQNETHTTSMGNFEVTKVRMHDDLLQEGLLKKDKKAASFVTIGEPDIKLSPAEEEEHVQVDILGLDIYDPIKDQVKARNRKDIAYWMVDDDYDGSNFVVKQIFFCGGSKDEFKDWEKGLNDLAKQSQKRNVERTLKIEIDEEAFDRLYGFKSHPIKKKKGQKIAVRVVSQFGEESTKVLGI